MQEIDKSFEISKRFETIKIMSSHILFFIYSHEAEDHFASSLSNIFKLTILIKKDARYIIVQIVCQY